MNKIRVIDILNKIANGEEVPQMVSCLGEKYHIDELERFYVNDDGVALLEYLFNEFNDFDALMTDVEAIEKDKKIEKIEEKEIEVSMAIGEQICANKINEIIDYLNNKENK